MTEARRAPLQRVVISEEGPDALKAYASIPIAYEVVETLDVDAPSCVGDLLPFAVRAVDRPRRKDYDAQPDNHPMDWAGRFDVRRWGFLSAGLDGEKAGGAIVVARAADAGMLNVQNDAALLWDIRVAPAIRRRGVGTALLLAASSWVRAHGARTMVVETQNTNVPACRFYASHGFVLRDVIRGAYPTLPDEVQLLWYKDLG